MTPPPPPRLSRAPTFPLVWVVPLVALAVAGWMILRQWHTRGPEIVVQFADGGGIEAGRTILQHKGVTVGRVIAVELAEDLRHVRVRLRLERNAGPIARAGSEFWIVQPEISFGGIRGLETLLSGVRLAVRPGDGETQREFRGLDRPPPTRNLHAGRAFLLEADRLSGISPGTTVTYRDISVGAVEETRLAEDARKVLIRVRIHEPYAALVRPNTRFWNSGGLSLRVGLLGAQLDAGTLGSLFSGGISFATPDDDIRLPAATDGARYVLHEEADNDWLKWAPAIPIEAPQARPPSTASASASGERAETP